MAIQLSNIVNRSVQHCLVFSPFVQETVSTFTVTYLATPATLISISTQVQQETTAMSLSALAFNLMQRPLF